MMHVKAAREYQARYPNQHQPDNRLFGTIYQRLGEFGSFHSHYHVGHPRNVASFVNNTLLLKAGSWLTCCVAQWQKFKRF